MKEIPLANGRGVALCDDADFEHLSQFKWVLQHHKTGIGRLRACNYAVRGVYLGRSPSGSPKMRTVSMHRDLIPDGECVLHLDFDGLNNQRLNLVAASRSDRAHHSRKRLSSASNFKGVERLASGRFRAYICKDGTVHHLGTFADEQSAAVAFDQFALQMFGNKATLNLPGVERKESMRQLQLKPIGSPFGSRYRGVCRKKDRWRARIMVKGAVKNLGYFESEAEAARAYDTAARALRGKKALTNFSA